VSRGVHRQDRHRLRAPRGGPPAGRRSGPGPGPSGAPHRVRRLVRAALPAQGGEHLGPERGRDDAGPAGGLGALLRWTYEPALARRPRHLPPRRHRQVPRPDSSRRPCGRSHGQLLGPRRGGASRQVHTAGRRLQSGRQRPSRPQRHGQPAQNLAQRLPDVRVAGARGRRGRRAEPADEPSDRIRVRMSASPWTALDCGDRGPGVSWAGSRCPRLRPGGRGLP
jgi:hypothetical protein